MAGRRKPTSTSNFGVSRRESHDASDFYARFTPPELAEPDDVEIATEKAVDDVFVGDSRDMTQGPRPVGGARGHVAAVLRGQGVRAGARRGPRARHLPRLPRDAHRRVRRVRAHARARRAHRGQRRRTSAGARTGRSRPTSSTSSRTGSACCCAARSSGRRRAARPATARGDRSRSRPTRCFAISPSGSSSPARAASTAPSRRR